MATYMGLAVPLVGNSDITGNVTITGTVGITGATTITGALSLASSRITQMILGTVALATLASNASATVALSGLTTGMVVGAFDRAAGNVAAPVLWPAAADQLGYGAPGMVLAARTINVWAFATA